MRTKILESPTDKLLKLRLSMPASGDPRVVVNLAGLARTIIITRTQKGISSSGTPFKAYSTKRYYASIERRPPGYPKPTGGRTEHLRTGKKLKSVVYAEGYAGYKRGIGRSGKPELTVSGKMLGAIQIANAGPTVAFLFFSGREEAAKAHGHEFGTTVPARPFFDISDFTSEAELKAEAFKSLKDLARRAQLELKGRV